MSLVRSQLSGGYDSTHIYYNINITNNNNGANVAPPQVIFNETRNTPYLGNPSEYYMSVVRFSLETPSLPIWLPQVSVGQSNPNQTIYSFTLSYDLSGNTYNQQVYLTYVPQNTFEPVAKPPVTFQDITSDYYFVYNVQSIVQMMNTTLQTAFGNLKTAINALPGAPQLPTNNAPFFEYNPNNSTFILDADISGYNLNSTTYTPIKIWANASMYNLLSSFDAVNYGTSNITNGKNFLFNVRYAKGGNVFPFQTAGPPGSNFNTQNCLQLYQDYPTLPLWCPIQSMVFTTALLPVVPELTAIPVVFGANSKYASDGNNSNISPTLTDFEVQLTNGFEFKPNITYAPSGEYRLTDLYGNTPLSALEVRVFWKDIFGNLHPFYLNEGCNASIKIMFRKKIYNSPVY